MKVEIFKAGTWKGDTYSIDDIDSMVKNFKTLQGDIKPPLKLGHNKEQMKSILSDGHPALGWISGLERNGETLVANFTDVPKVVKSAIKKKLYKTVSSEIRWNAKVNDKVFDKVLVGVALLGADLPAVTGLKELETYFADKKIKIEEDVELKDINICKQYSAPNVFKTTIKNKNNQEDKKNMEKAELIKKIAELEVEVKKAEKEKAEKEKAFSEFVKKQAKLEDDKKVNSFLSKCETLVKEKKLAPATRDQFVSLFDEKNYSENDGADRKAIVKVIEPMEKILESQTKFFKDELGLEDDGSRKETKYTSVYDEVDCLAKEYSTKNKVDYDKAVYAVLSENKDLSKKYMAA